MKNLRIGVWFDARHLSFGGPTRVLLGTIQGFYQYASTQNIHIVVLLNEPGDYNWFLDSTENFLQSIYKAPQALLGPCVLNIGFSEKDEYTKSNHWKHGMHFLIPSAWTHFLISQNGYPFLEQDLAGPRSLSIWPSGVDANFFCPSGPRTQDFFVYHKSQHYDELEKMFRYLFNNYFYLRGNILVYYHYDADMLREAASKSRFCIMLDRPETQGLASLEIMACDCPLFVLDSTVFYGEKQSLHGVTSVTCMDDRCGMKSSFSTFQDDFSVFLSKLESYTPRAYVLESYSFEKAAERLINLV